MDPVVRASNNSAIGGDLRCVNFRSSDRHKFSNYSAGAHIMKKWYSFIKKTWVKDSTLILRWSLNSVQVLNLSRLLPNIANIAGGAQVQANLVWLAFTLLFASSKQFNVRTLQRWEFSQIKPYQTSGLGVLHWDCNKIGWRGTMVTKNCIR